MPVQLSFLNLSLKKILHPDQSILDKARVRLLYYGLLATFFTYMVATILMFGQSKSTFIAIAVFVDISLIGLFKYLTWTGNWRRVSHALLVVITIVNLDYVFVDLQTVNILTIQLIILTIQFSFYMLGKRYGAFYTLLNVIPIFMFMALQYKGDYMINIGPHLFNGTVSTITIITNFALIIFIHTHFFTAFLNTIKQLKKTTELQAVLNQDLEEAVKKAGQSAEAKADFLSTMSHEIRTPLNAVMGMTNIMMMANPRPDQKENLEVLKYSASNLMAIVNDVLDFSKIEKGNISFDNVPFNLQELMVNICGAQRIKAEEKGLKFNLQVDDFLQHNDVIGDGIRITQVIYNLVSNAVKFTLSGSVWVNVTTTNLTGKIATVNFSVKDTGIGIKKANLDTVFDAFAQECMSATRQYAGTGLGLAIVKRLLELQNIEIVVNSMINVGSEFSFEMDFPLPVLNKKDERQNLSNPAQHTQPQTKMFGSIRVLIAEDNEVNITLMKRLLSRWNISPTFAENGLRAVELLNNADFDIILMDLQMPVKNGFQAAMDIRAMADPRKAGVPIIALSASALSEIKDKVKEAGMNDYLSKPFRPEHLKEKMQQLLFADLQV